MVVSLCLLQSPITVEHFFDKNIVGITALLVSCQNSSVVRFLCIDPTVSGSSPTSA